MGKTIGFLIMDISGAGGTERAASAVANGLSARGDRVYLISCRGGELCRYPLREEVTLISLHGEQFPNSAIRKLRVSRRLRQAVKQYGIEILVGVDTALFLYQIPLRIRGLCRCIAWENFHYDGLPTPERMLARKLAAHLADAVVVLTKRDLEKWRKRHGTQVPLCQIYPPAEMGKPIQNSALIHQKEKTVIAVGRLCHQKGFDLLLEAWRNVEAEHPDWRLRIYGEGEAREELEQMICSLGLCRAKLCGFSSDISTVYQNADLFVLSSRMEGLGLVLAEALSYGVACISFDCQEGPSEVIHDGVDGMLVEPEDTVALASALRTLMDDDKRRAEMSQHA